MKGDRQKKDFLFEEFSGKWEEQPEAKKVNGLWYVKSNVRGCYVLAKVDPEPTDEEFSKGESTC